MIGDMPTRWNSSWHWLLFWSDGQARSEALAAQIVRDAGYTDINPSHPLGGPDGKADAILYKDGRRCVMAVYFPHGPQSVAKVKAKLRSDALGVPENDAEGLVFVTNQRLSLGERKQLEEAIDVPVDIFHLAKLATVLDSPNMAPVKELFVGLTTKAQVQVPPLAAPPDWFFEVKLEVNDAVMDSKEMVELTASRRRLAVVGPAGAGKTYWAGRIAAEVSAADRTAVVTVGLSAWEPAHSKSYSPPNHCLRDYDRLLMSFSRVLTMT